MLAYFNEQWNEYLKLEEIDNKMGIYTVAQLFSILVKRKHIIPVQITVPKQSENFEKLQNNLNTWILPRIQDATEV